MGQLSSYILQKAREADICEPWAEQIAETDNVDSLLAMYVQGIDFCLEKNFPSNEDLVILGGHKLKAYGIYVDAVIDCPVQDFIVLLGDCSGKIYKSGFSASQIFVKHRSASTIHVSENAFVMIDCFDDTTVDLVASGNGKVAINVYGNANVTHQALDNSIVKIIHKNKTTY
ncbi:hypothetical protein [Mucilaginibacter lappiensis]|uniref:Uncharacterized protein n=1 Tax=Mucilaginibacter lappiensis TaxID=354630 RepID=A0A841JBL8_9SPHI|nr:hypothetical protein [Mucilaginibacter lappiensis]MBB6126966.1 hypothetical protein [Mucilaginibacter lappiensis]